MFDEPVGARGEVEVLLRVAAARVPQLGAQPGIRERGQRVGERDGVARGHDEATVRKVERLLYLAEYKRRQAAPGVKITRKNFGRDRRYPITNTFRDRG